ncbi:MFS transporter [Erwinia oleae]|uniref:MFS transporter n=1 Tax=Erwinia oleae TaxID=796334 RepID=UPI00055425FC|nr:MFS transporter [Erwinia oleae]
MAQSAAEIRVDTPANRMATRATFFVTGMAMGLWAALVPFAQQRTGAEANQLGLLLLCLGAGSLLSMSGSGPLIGRLGCRAVIIISVTLYILMLPLLATLNDLWLLGGSLFLFGMGIGLTDVAMNVQGSIIEQAADKPLMSGFHCLWSVGGIAGAGGGALLFSVGLTPLTSTFCAMAATAVVLGISYRSLLTVGNQEKKGEKRGGKPDFYLILIALMTLLCFMAEGAVIDWSGVFMHQQRGMDVARAGWGFAVFSLMMSLMRLTGDAVVQRLGRKRILVMGGLLGTIGYSMVVLLPGWVFSLVGFALIGIGAANIVPVLITLAGQQKSMPVNMSVALVTAVGYLGVLGGPALLGWVAHYASLYVAFSFLIVGFLIITLGALKLRYSR